MAGPIDNNISGAVLVNESNNAFNGIIPTSPSGSVNGVLVPQAYGTVSGSPTTTTGSISSGSQLLTLASVSGWVAGHGIKISGAGPACAVSTPAQPTCVVTGGSGTSRTYKAVALDGLGGYTASSTVSASASSNASLDRVTNYVTITLTPVAGVFAYILFEVGSGRVVAIVPNSSGLGNTTILVKDYGQSITISGTPDFPSSPPSSAHNSALLTKITSLNGTIATLADVATTAVSGATVMHDDSKLFAQALATFSAATGGRTFAPKATYIINSPIVIGSVGATVGNGYEIEGTGRGATILQAGVGLCGLPVFKLVNMTMCRIAHMKFLGVSGAPYLTAVELNRNDPTAGTATGYIKLEDLDIGFTDQAGHFIDGVEYTAAPSWDDNNQSNILLNCDIANGLRAGLYIGHANSLENQIIGGVCQGGDFGILLNGGSFKAVGVSDMGAANNLAGTWHVGFGPGTYLHESHLVGCSSESAGNIAWADTNAIGSGGDTESLNIVSCDFNSGVAGNTFDIESSTIGVRASHSHLCTGTSNATAVFKGTAKFFFNRLGIATNAGNGLSYNASLEIVGNSWAPGTVTLTNMGSGKLKAQLFNVSGGLGGNLIDADGSTSPGTLAISVNGTVAASFDGSGGLQMNSNYIASAKLVGFVGTAAGSLPSAASSAGQIYYVTDANATTIGTVVAGGGSNKVLVFSNSSVWHIMAS